MKLRRIVKKDKLAVSQVVCTIVMICLTISVIAPIYVFIVEGMPDMGVIKYHLNNIFRSGNPGEPGESGGSNPKAPANQPPNAPFDPNPDYGEKNVDIYHDLRWKGGDPDPGDTVTYDVYFEADDPNPDDLVSEDQSETTYDPGVLENEVTYYWKIVAWDDKGLFTEGPIWSFTTDSEEDGEGHDGPPPASPFN